jgi:hypothetical protein
MKRDFDLIRRILIDIENLPAGGTLDRLSYPDYDQATINQHVALLLNEKIITGLLHDSFQGIDGFFVTGLTWKGHDFIDAARDESIWAKANNTVLKSTVAFTFDLLLEWLKHEAKQSLGLQ